MNSNKTDDENGKRQVKQYPPSIKISSLPLSASQTKWLHKAFSFLDERIALKLNESLTNIYSYTGHEREINEYVVNYFKGLAI